MKNKKQKNKKNADQGLRRLGVIIEHVDGNVRLIAEQQGDIKKTLNSHTETLNSHTEAIGNLAVGLEVVKSDLGVVKKDVKTTKVDIEIIKADIEFIKNSVKKKIDVDEFAALERRVVLLEKHR